MRDRDGELTRMFVRDLDDIALPPRNAWRPAPRRRAVLMKATGYVMAAAVVAVVLIGVLVWSFGTRSNPVAASHRSSAPAASATPSASPSAATATAVIAPTSSSAPSTVATAVITGRLGYPAEIVPPLTIYAISVNDPNIWYSTSTPLFGTYTGASPTPAPPAATWPPTGEGTYQLKVPAGTYYVLGYLDRSFPGASDKPVAYTHFTVECLQPRPSTPSPACSSTDHALIPVTVRAGETVSRIDISDWLFQGGTYPPRPTSR